MTTTPTDEVYQQQLLQGVSRTFALTIPQLPPNLYKSVGNGYLLCRIADTIEDDPALSPAQKALFSQQLVQVLEGSLSAQVLSRNLLPTLSNASPAEQQLIANMSRVIRLTHSCNAIQQAALIRCVRIMTEGMVHFQQHSSISGLKDMAELDHYCYVVAGVVGEMLTELFCDYSPQIAKHESELRKLAVSFGQGLQMTNILKDIWDDQQRGMCWLPQSVFDTVGFELRDLALSTHPPEFAQGLTPLIHTARQHLSDALRYILLIPRHEQGIRRFCLWALGMALLTLRNIHAHREFTDGKQVKISRRAVKTTVIVSNVAGYSNTALRSLFYLLASRL
jgi:farnesyl-diphosphate farnesyltransferase